MVMFNHNIIGKMMINHDKPWNLCIFLPFYHDFPSSIGSIGRPWALGSPSREMASQLEILQLQTSHLKGGAEMERCTYIYDYIYIHILNISIYTQYDIHATCIDNVCIYNVCVYIYMHEAPRPPAMTHVRAATWPREGHRHSSCVVYLWNPCSGS
jgi:hypothetical protein